MGAGFEFKLAAFVADRAGSGEGESWSLVTRCQASTIISVPW
jgi:hypothetical protein